MKKHELTDDTITVGGRILHRIKALKSFSDVEEGDLGGYVEKEDNLDHSGEAWVSGNARVYGNAWVCRDAWVYGNARVSGDARVSGENDYAAAKGFGREYRTTTFFRLQDGGIGVRCGCFCGTLEEFREEVKETHKESKMGKEYLMLADLMEYKFKNA